MHYLTKKDIIDFAEKFAKQFDEENCILIPENLDYCIKVPQQEFYGYEVYPTIEEKAASYLWHFIKYHPFYSANKRIAFAVTDTFLILNKRKLVVNEDEGEKIALEIGECGHEVNFVAEWIRENLKVALES
jgi:death-on-curing protein